MFLKLKFLFLFQGSSLVNLMPLVTLRLPAGAGAAASRPPGGTDDPCRQARAAPAPAPAPCPPFLRMHLALARTLRWTRASSQWSWDQACGALPGVGPGRGACSDPEGHGPQTSTSFRGTWEHPVSERGGPGHWDNSDVRTSFATLTRWPTKGARAPESPERAARGRRASGERFPFPHGAGLLHEALNSLSAPTQIF